MVTPGGLEIELKLLADPADFKRLLTHPEVTRRCAEPPRRHHQITTYFDTPAHRLAESGLTLRIRQVGRRFTQSVKARSRAVPGQSAGAAMRQEWEWPVPGGHPNLAVLGEVGLAGVLSARDLAAIKPIFVADVERTSIVLDAADEASIELVLDEGAIIAGTRRHAIAEIELELRRDRTGARAGRLYDLALALHQTVPLQVATASKADLGYALITGPAAEPHKAQPIQLEPKIDVDEAVARILRGCIGHLLDNQDCVLNARHGSRAAVEGIHQMRVALRRLRAALGLFAKRLDRASVAPLKQQLRWLAGELSPARDWDVFVSETLPRCRGDAAKSARRIRPVAAAQRGAARRRAEAAVRDPRYTALILSLGGWIEERRWRPSGAALGSEGEAFAPALLERSARKARKAGRHIREQTIEDRHTLRKALKTLRYGATFLGELYPGRRTARYIDALADLQELLGQMNDLAVARVRLSELGLARDPELAAAGAIVDATFAKQLERRLAGLPSAWCDFKEVKPFWR